MNTELKRQALSKGKIIKSKVEDFCFGTIVLTTRTYEVPTFNYEFNTSSKTWSSWETGVKKIYNVEVIVDGEVVADRWGTGADEMNKEYLTLKFHCEG